MRVQFALAWAVLAFLFNYMPSIGVVVFVVSPMTRVLLFSGIHECILVGALFLVVHMAIDSILEPRMMGHCLGMSIMVVFLSLLIWGWLPSPVEMPPPVSLTSIRKIWVEATKGGSKLVILLGPGRPKGRLPGRDDKCYDMHFHFPLNVGPDMYRITLGKVSTLSAASLLPGLHKQILQGSRHGRRLAGRVLPSYILPPLPEIIYGEQGKPVFTPETLLWFNLSYSGGDIALLLSDEGEAGCDIEVTRPCANRCWLANAVLSLGEHAEVDAVYPDQQLETFQRIRIRKEVTVKQRGSSTW